MLAALSNDPGRPTGMLDGPAVGPASTARRGAGVPAVLVLDTNIVLDWLVFDDPSVAAVQGAITSGRVRWVASPAMRDELESVLSRDSLLAWRPDAPRSRSIWQRWATIVSAPETAPEPRLRCTDPDDQKFIDLALQVGAAALLSRDRALLRLAGRAGARGLSIMTGAAWTLTHAS
jgi:predicted nucleic acid-binding protein